MKFICFILNILFMSCVVADESDSTCWEGAIEEQEVIEMTKARVQNMQDSYFMPHEYWPYDKEHLKYRLSPIDCVKINFVIEANQSKVNLENITREIYSSSLLKLHAKSKLSKLKFTKSEKVFRAAVVFYYVTPSFYNLPIGLRNKMLERN